MSVTVIIPGHGSEHVDDAVIVCDVETRRTYVTGIAYDDQTGGYNMPDGPCLIPYGLTVPVSCILHCDPALCDLPEPTP